MPFLDHGAGVISRDVHSVEVGVVIESLDLINLELELSPGSQDSWLWAVAIIERDLDNTSSKTVTGLGQTCSLVTRHQSDNSFFKSWGQDIVPLFFGKWMGSKT